MIEYANSPKPSGVTQLMAVGSYSPTGIEMPKMSPLRSAYLAAGVGIAAYHGYKRNKSVGWAIAWGLLGGLSPIITNAVALAQGYAKLKR